MATYPDDVDFPPVPEWTEEAMAEHAAWYEREGERKARSIACKVSRRSDTRCSAFFDEVKEAAFTAMWEEAGFIGVKAYRHGFNAAMRAASAWRSRGMKGKGFRRFAGVSDEFNPVSQARDYRRLLDAEAIEEAKSALASMEPYEVATVRAILGHNPHATRLSDIEKLRQAGKMKPGDAEAKRAEAETILFDFVAESFGR